MSEDTRPKDLLHPSALLVRDLMTVGAITCAPDTPLADLARLVLDKNLEAVVILDEGNAVGAVDQDDLVRAYARQDAWSLKAEDIMQEEVPEVPPDIPMIAAAQRMQDEGKRAVFLMHYSAGIGYPAGLLTYRHVLRHLAARSPEELRDLGIQAQRQSPLEAFIQRRDSARRIKR
jgi:CBS domain-containing protein